MAFLRIRLPSPPAPDTASGMPATPATEGRLVEWLLRTIAVVVMGFVVMTWGRFWWANPARWTALLLLVSESYTLALVLVARRATTRDLSVPAIVASAYALGFLLLLRPDGTTHLVPEAVGAALQVASIGWQFTAKITLGRSFGILPARRGLVTAGPYRLVRHPIYFGYLIGHVGFILANFSWRNAAVLALLYAAQAVRVQREEAVLAKAEPAYRDYQRRVRWRLLPLVW